MIDKNIETERIVELPEPFENYIKEFETEFQCKLPKFFVEFLRQYSGSSIEAEIDILEPNPLGTTVLIDTIFDFSGDEDIRENTRIGDGYPVAIPFASDMMNNWYYLYLGHDNDESKVFFFDLQGRFEWSEDDWKRMFENLDPAIKEYLEKRKNNLIPTKKSAFNNFYLVGETFENFIKNLKPVIYDDE